MGRPLPLPDAADFFQAAAILGPGPTNRPPLAVRRRTRSYGRRGQLVPVQLPPLGHDRAATPVKHRSRGRPGC